MSSITKSCGEGRRCRQIFGARLNYDFQIVRRHCKDLRKQVEDILDVVRVRGSSIKLLSIKFYVSPYKFHTYRRRLDILLEYVEASIGEQIIYASHELAEVIDLQRTLPRQFVQMLIHNLNCQARVAFYMCCERAVSIQAQSRVSLELTISRSDLSTKVYDRWNSCNYCSPAAQRSHPLSKAIRFVGFACDLFQRGPLPHRQNEKHRSYSKGYRPPEPVTEFVVFRRHVIAPCVDPLTIGEAVTALQWGRA